MDGSGAWGVGYVYFAVLYRQHNELEWEEVGLGYLTLGLQSPPVPHNSRLTQDRYPARPQGHRGYRALPGSRPSSFSIYAAEDPVFVQPLS